MEEIKNLYVLEWYGPYASIDDIWNDDNTCDCSVYAITGKSKYERGNEYIKYIGITERDPASRLSDKDHSQKQKLINYKRYWVAKFSRTSNRNLRSHAELIEHLFIRYLSVQYDRIINDKKIKSCPKKPIAVISRWHKQTSGSTRVNKPQVLSELPDILVFDGCEYWGAGKLVRFLSEETIL